MTRTYNPFAIERPTLELGEHGSFTLGDITESRGAKLDKIIEQVGAMTIDKSTTVKDLATVVGELCEAACVGADGLSDTIVELCDEDTHGEEALGINQLVGVAQFVMGWVSGEDSAGEG